MFGSKRLKLILSRREDLRMTETETLCIGKSALVHPKSWTSMRSRSESCRPRSKSTTTIVRIELRVYRMRFQLSKTRQSKPISNSLKSVLRRPTSKISLRIVLKSWKMHLRNYSSRGWAKESQNLMGLMTILVEAMLTRLSKRHKKRSIEFHRTTKTRLWQLSRRGLKW